MEEHKSNDSHRVPQQWWEGLWCVWGFQCIFVIIFTSYFHLYDSTCIFYYVAKFKDICPGGMGYTVLPNPPVNKPVTVHQAPIEPLPLQPLPTPERPVEAFGKPEEIIPGESKPCFITSACTHIKHILLLSVWNTGYWNQITNNNFCAV